jgi:xanthine dehydrogenase accessory factor
MENKQGATEATLHSGDSADSGQQRERPTAVVWGGGDLGTGAARALVANGWRVLVADRPQPTALRLTVAFAAAAQRGRMVVEGVEAVHVLSIDRAAAVLAAGGVPVWTGPLAELLALVEPDVLVDCRLRGLTSRDLHRGLAPFVVALGPGGGAGRDAHAVVETARGPDLGAVLWSGLASPHTGIPGEVCGRTHERLLRTPATGTLRRVRQLGDLVAPGEVVATVAGEPVRARIAGMIRGLKADGCEVAAGHKVGDVDPRCDPALLDRMTDKAKIVGAGVAAAAAAWLAGRAGLAAGGPRDEPATTSRGAAARPAAKGA